MLLYPDRQRPQLVFQRLVPLNVIVSAFSNYPM